MFDTDITTTKAYDTAQRLLLDENVIIKDVYKQSGFSSAQNMRRVFVKTIGMSPSESLKNLD